MLCWYLWNLGASELVIFGGERKVFTENMFVVGSYADEHKMGTALLSRASAKVTRTLFADCE